MPAFRKSIAIECLSKETQLRPDLAAVNQESALLVRPTNIDAGMPATTMAGHTSTTEARRSCTYSPPDNRNKPMREEVLR